MNEKVILMDWHASWHKATAIPVAVSPACDAQDLRDMNFFFCRYGCDTCWTKDHAGLYVLRTIAMSSE